MLALTDPTTTSFSSTSSLFRAPASILSVRPLGETPVRQTMPYGLVSAIASKATKAIVAFLLVVSAVIVLIITLGGWDTLEGAKALQIAYILVYLLMAFLVMRWNRGVLPVAAALAVLFAVVAAVAAPAWFERDKAGFEDPALDPGMLGLLTAIIVPVQLLLVAFAMRGFQQQWNVEVEVAPDEADHGGIGDGPPGGRVQPA